MVAFLPEWALLLMSVACPLAAFAFVLWCLYDSYRDCQWWREHEVTDRDNIEGQVGDLLALVAANVGHDPSAEEVAEFCLITLPVLAGVVFTFDSGRIVSHTQAITELRRQVNDLTDQVHLLRAANQEIASGRTAGAGG